MAKRRAQQTYRQIAGELPVAPSTIAHMSIATYCALSRFGIRARYFDTVSMFRFWNISTMVLFWMATCAVALESMQPCA